MTPDNRLKLKNLLLHDEDIKLFPYTDTKGKLTIGCGRNLTDRGITQPEALAMLDDDILYFSYKLDMLLPWIKNISEIRQIVLISMAFNLGLQGFLDFKEMLLACEQGNYEEAAQEILNSEAARELRNRYQRYAYIMRTNVL